MKQLLIISVLLVIGLKGFGQIESMNYPSGKLSYEKIKTDSGYLRIWYYESGNKKSESTLDKQGTWIYTTDWNEEGIITEERNLLQERLDRGQRDLSFIKWNDKDKVDIYFFERDSLSNHEEQVNDGDSIIFHYICFDEFGFDYDNSITRGEPSFLVVGNNYFIASFNQAMLKLSVGDKVYIRIPYHYGYGEEAAGNVPPKTNLIYYIEIINIIKK